MSSAAGPSDESDPNPDESTTLRVRCEDGHVLWLTLRACDPLSAVAAAVLVHRGAEAGPFALRVPFPPVEYSTPEQLSTSLRRARLVPRGALLVLPEAARGVVRQASFGDWRAARANLAQAQAAMGPEDDTMQQAMQRMLEQMAVGGDGLPPAVGGGAPNMDYEALLQWEEQMGGAVAHGLTLTELAALPTRTLTTADVPALDPAAAGSAGEQPDPEGELGRCCICCCEFVSGDRLMSLPCTHAFHAECIAPWLRAKRTCPLCKQCAVAGGDAEPSY